MMPIPFNDDEIKHFKSLLKRGLNYVQIGPHFPDVTQRQIQHWGLKFKKELGMKIKPAKAPRMIKVPLYMLESKLDFTWMNIETGGM